MDTKVFISKGSAATSEQRKFVDSILSTLRTVGLSPRIMNENEWSHEQPLRAIKNIMKECCGTVVIAFTRTTYPSGTEVRNDGNRELNNVSLPTPWNQIEASMAYSFSMPLLVIAENGLKSEGLIENGYDWRVYWTDLNPDEVATDQFRGFLDSWKKAVNDFEDKKNSTPEKQLDLEKVSIGKLLTLLSVPQLWKLGAAIISVLAFVAATAFKVGGGKWPWQ